MRKISLSTNVDLQNYKKRIGVIAKEMEPLGIEIFSLPQNYANKMQLELPEKADSDRFALLSKELARGIGKEFKEYGLSKIQFHYPWQKRLLDMDGHDIALTFEFCEIIYQESGAGQMTINYHNVLKYPTPSMVQNLGGEVRKNIMKELELQTEIAQLIKDNMKSSAKLIVENNPAVSVDEDKKTGENILDNVDLVAEDFIDRKGVEGVNLDYSHAWTVVRYFQEEKTYPNLEWCRKQYRGVPESARSMKNFVRKVAPQVDWVHLSDEPHPYTHSGSHMGEGVVDFAECADLFERHLTKEVVATIEVKDGHTPEGFKRVLEHDLPFLREHFS